MSRPGERARWIAQRRTLIWVRANSLMLVGFAGIVLLLDFVLRVAFKLLDVPLATVARSEGLLIGLGVGVITIFISTQSGAFTIGAGADAEGWTAKELRKHRSAGYLLINNVQFQGFDVDHVAIGPAGAFAIETKWASARWVLSEDRLEGPLRDPIGQASDGARQIHRFLNVAMRLGVPVHPVLVIWGPGQPTMESGSNPRGVHVLTGRSKDRWESVFSGGPLRQADVDKAHRALSNFAKERNNYERKASGHRFSYRVTLFIRLVAAFGIATTVLILWVIAKSLLDG